MADLYPYQRAGVEYLERRRSALLADEMGLGKTAQALSLMARLGRDHGALVVCPASVKGVWESEARAWAPGLEARVFRGRNSVRCWPLPGELFILNYEILPDPEKLGHPPTPVVMVADEAHYLKSSKAKRTKRWRVMARRALGTRGRVYLLTGTPLMNQPLDLWNVLRAASLETRSFRSWPRFVRYFNGFRGRFGYKWGKVHPRAHEVLSSVMLRRSRRAVLSDLPAKRYQTLIVNGIAEGLRRRLEQTREDLAELGIDLERCIREIQLDGELSDRSQWGEIARRLSTVRAALAEGKVPGALEIVEEYVDAGEPLVVFSAHRKPAEAIAERFGGGLIIGGTPEKQRTALVRKFQDRKMPILCGTIGAMGVGLTLTAAAHVLFVDLDWTPSANAQAEDRVCRIGQHRGVLIRRLVADHPVDRHVTKLLTAKQAIIAASVEGEKNETRPRAVSDAPRLF